VMAVNLDGAFFSLRAAARHMVERGGGGSLVSTGEPGRCHGRGPQENTTRRRRARSWP